MDWNRHLYTIIKWDFQEEFLRKMDDIDNTHISCRHGLRVTLALEKNTLFLDE